MTLILSARGSLTKPAPSGVIKDLKQINIVRNLVSGWNIFNLFAIFINI